MTRRDEPEADLAPAVDAVPGRRSGFAAGVLAGLVFLCAVALLRLTSGERSVPEIVADAILYVLPGGAFSALLDSLQHAAKPLLFVGIGIGTLVLGGLLGRVYGARPSWKRAVWLVLGLWLMLGGVVYPIAGGGLFGVGYQAGLAWHAVTLLGLLAVFGVTLVLAQPLVHARASRRRVPQQARRTLLLGGLGGLLAATITGMGWRFLLAQSGAEPATFRSTSSDGSTPANEPPFDIPGLSSEVTPNGSFYTVSKNFIDPSVDAAGWRLKVDGMVAQPLDLTYEQLTQLPASDGYYTLMCISNPVGGSLISNALWHGVKLPALLAQAGVQPGATRVILTAGDDYTDSITIEQALQTDALLAWEMNGAPLPKEHGYPARLLIPGSYGMKNVKWLTGLTLTNASYSGYWQDRGWDDDAPEQTMSRIDVPQDRDTLEAGSATLAGIAFAGARGIVRVEVSLDGGTTWLPADLKPGLSPYTWQLWRLPTNLARGATTIHVRGTDGGGATQVAVMQDPFPSGATGQQAIEVVVLG